MYGFDRFNKSLIALAGMLALIGLISLVTPLSSRGQGSSGNAPPTQNVNVVNTSDNPVPVHNINDPARQPIVAEISLTMPDGQHNSGGTIFTVPSGKLLVIEYVSARTTLPAGQSINGIGLNSHLNGAFSVPVWFEATRMSNPSHEILHSSQQVRIYADSSVGGGHIEVFFNREPFSSGVAGLVLIFYGYLVDAQ